MMVPVWVVALVALVALLSATGQFLFKLASADITADLMSYLTNWKFIVGAAFHAIAALVLVYALKFGNLSVLVPIIATNYIWVTIFSVVFLKEVFPLFKAAGIFFILLGVIIIVQ